MNHKRWLWLHHRLKIGFLGAIIVAKFNTFVSYITGVHRHTLLLWVEWFIHIHIVPGKLLSIKSKSHSMQGCFSRLYDNQLLSFEFLFSYNNDNSTVYMWNVGLITCVRVVHIDRLCFKLFNKVDVCSETWEENKSSVESVPSKRTFELNRFFHIDVIYTTIYLSLNLFYFDVHSFKTVFKMPLNLQLHNRFIRVLWRISICHVIEITFYNLFENNWGVVVDLKLYTVF